MSTLNEIKWSLVTLSIYEPLAYVDEVNEIFDCIFENKSYDEASALDRLDLVEVVEFLGYSRYTKVNRPNPVLMTRLRDLADSTKNIDEDMDVALRAKIRRILLGS